MYKISTGMASRAVPLQYLSILLKPYSLDWRRDRIRSTCTLCSLKGLLHEMVQVNSAFHPFEVDKWVVSCNRMSASSHGLWRLVNAYGVKA